MSFFTIMQERIDAVDSLLCIGIDPHVSDLSQPTSRVLLDYCMRLVEGTADVAAAFKPNIAFFEVFGEDGISVLRKVISAIPDGIPVILDAKRGDIASSAQAYATAAFETLGADAITISPYLGYDSVVPFLENPERGAFLLCKTSNPSAGDLQDLPIAPIEKTVANLVYEQVAVLAQNWNNNDNLGLVVGATYPEALKRIRELAPQVWILAPGFGAQGADLTAALRFGLRSDGSGILFPVSRQISRAANPREVAEEIRSIINHERVKLYPRSSNDHKTILPDHLSSLADDLLEAGCIRFGEFKLKSGIVSPIYIDQRKLVGFPRLLSQVAWAYVPILKKLVFERLAGIPYAGLPIGTAISLQTGWPLVYPRKEIKAYGTKAEIEGVFTPGEQAVIIDDLATTGESKFEAIEKLSAVGLHVNDVVVLIDRQSGASEDLSQAGYSLHAVFTLTQLLDHWESRGCVPTDQIKSVRDFLSGG